MLSWDVRTPPFLSSARRNRATGRLQPQSAQEAMRWGKPLMRSPSSSVRSSREKPPSRTVPLRLGGTLFLIALGAGCSSEMDRRYWDRTPARPVAYNRYVPAEAIRYNPRRNTGVAYLPSRAGVSTTRTTTVTSEKEIVEVERY
jgi:hypothetical protein